MSFSASCEGMPMCRQQELEMEKKLASILNEPKGTAAVQKDNSQELERLAQRVRAAEDDAARLRQALRSQVTPQ